MRYCLETRLIIAQGLSVQVALPSGPMRAHHCTCSHYLAVTIVACHLCAPGARLKLPILLLPRSLCANSRRRLSSRNIPHPACNPSKHCHCHTTDLVHNLQCSSGQKGILSEPSLEGPCALTNKGYYVLTIGCVHVCIYIHVCVCVRDRNGSCSYAHAPGCTSNEPTCITRVAG